MASPEGKKSERLEVRVSGDGKALIAQAAQLEGRTVSDFVVASALEAASRTIQEHGLLYLSQQDQQVFVEAILNPPEPNDELRQAAKEYQRSVKSVL
ncbi:DUF1778 domain-containing protein [Gloeobacter morelensis]|uniref:DUF1778 domain-containing protein n=1 Tax=Gloeobacter morelensis MG652769 TaxID=2781736 RepID=A0ABY3PST8_9CYAN|nr:DUF1778 domain-containing protein [Gloeobacter morelensis]UFP96765.1 DUF1778 domain-containing protein [Gloeobacter morelensis MG652769]